jgi:hypothetical protein
MRVANRTSPVSSEKRTIFPSGSIRTTPDGVEMLPPRFEATRQQMVPVFRSRHAISRAAPTTILSPQRNVDARSIEGTVATHFGTNRIFEPCDQRPFVDAPPRGLVT